MTEMTMQECVAESAADYERRCSFDQPALDLAQHLEAVFVSEPKYLRVTKAQIAITELLMASTAPTPFPVQAAEPKTPQAESQGERAGRTGGAIPPTGAKSIAQQLADSLAREAELHRVVAQLKTDLADMTSRWDDEGSRANEVEAAVEAIPAAILSASYGAPSSWRGQNPPGWHLADQCSPRDASMHDNGINDAFRAFRLALSEGPSHE